MTTKSMLRKQLLSARNNLTPKQVSSLSLKVCQTIISNNLLEKGTIAFYKSMGNEINLQHAISWAIDNNCRCVLPKLHTKTTMDFVEINKDTIYKKNPHGYYEPTNQRVINKEYIDVMFIPVVGFDKNGNRLGRGAGHYDRYLEGISSKTKLIGVGYEFQLVDNIPTQEHDKKLMAIITEKSGYLEVEL